MLKILHLNSIILLLKRNRLNLKNKKINQILTIGFSKAVTNDIFTGDERYIYENLKTGEIITSSNPDLLDTLNGPKKKKVKEPKTTFVPIGKIIFKTK